MVFVRAGARICGHIELIEQLGPTFGNRILGPTFLAHDEETDAGCWITLVAAEFLPTSVDISRFMASANALNILRHSDFVRVSFVDREDRYCVVGAERLPGAQVWAEGGAALDRETAIDTASVLAGGLAHLHQRGVVHGLFCLGNAVRWERDSLLWQYGLAQLFDRARLAAACRDLGDVLAPEMLQGHVGAATDVFAWGQAVCELLTGRWGAEARTQFHAGHHGHSAAFLSLVRRCLRTDPASRPRDALEVVAELGAIHPIGRGRATTGTPRDSALGAQLPLPPTTGSDRHAPMARGGLELETFELETLDGQVDVEAAEDMSDAVAFESTDDARFGAATRLDLGGQQSTETSPFAHAGGDSGETLAAPTTGSESAPLRAAPYRVPRRPGPHGPPWWAMGPALASVSVLIVLFAVWRTHEQVAGWQFLVGSLLAGTAGSSADLAGPVLLVTGVTGSGSTAQGLASGERLEVAQQPSRPALSSPASRAKRRAAPACPPRTAPVGPRVCIDTGEYPGLRRTPRTKVSLRQAEGLCGLRGARLCTAVEWKRACAGDSGWAYPYGPRAEAERCNTASLAGFPHNPSYSGAHPRCVNSRGVFDLVGNVGEWVSEGVTMGGDSGTPLRRASCSATAQFDVNYRGADVGLRCCVDRK